MPGRAEMAAKLYQRARIRRYEIERGKKREREREKGEKAVRSTTTPCTRTHARTHAHGKKSASRMGFPVTAYRSEQKQKRSLLFLPRSLISGRQRR